MIHQLIVYESFYGANLHTQVIVYALLEFLMLENFQFLGLKCDSVVHSITNVCVHSLLSRRLNLATAQQAELGVHSTGTPHDALTWHGMPGVCLRERVAGDNKGGSGRIHHHDFANGVATTIV